MSILDRDVLYSFIFTICMYGTPLCILEGILLMTPAVLPCVTIFGVAIDKMKKDAHRSQFIPDKYKEMKYASAENRKKILSESEW